MRVGILGGTFDPPHIGHLALAKSAMEQLELDEVIWLPANRNPLKQRGTRTPPKDRFEMVKRLVAGEENMSVSDMEITRGGPSYTIDTLGELQMVQPADYWFILGADALRGLPGWKNPQRLLKLCRFAVAVRAPLTESDVLGRIPEDYKERVDVIKMTPMDVASSNLRDKLAKGQDVTPWMHKDVIKYIKEHKLYRE